MPGSARQRKELKVLTAAHAPADLARAVFPAVAGLDVPVPPSIPLSPAPAPSPEEVGRRVGETLAHVPQQGQPLTPAQHEVMDLLHVVFDKISYDRINEDLGLRVHQCVMGALYGGTK